MSRLLLDTHAFLWWVDGSSLLSKAATDAISDVRNDCYLSMASCWELAIKCSLGKLRLTKPVERFVSEHLAANAFTLLGIELGHIGKVQKMPFHHRDPFDRLLIAQASTEKLTIVTADRAFATYGAKILW